MARPSQARLQHLIADYTLGYVDQLDRQNGAKGAGSTGTEKIFFEGQKDAANPGRKVCDLAPGALDHRVTLRLRVPLAAPNFHELTKHAKLQALQREGQKVLDECLDDEDFHPTKAEAIDLAHAAAPAPAPNPFDGKEPRSRDIDD